MKKIYYLMLSVLLLSFTHNNAMEFKKIILSAQPSFIKLSVIPSGPPNPLHGTQQTTCGDLGCLCCGGCCVVSGILHCGAGDVGHAALCIAVGYLALKSGGAEF